MIRAILEEYAGIIAIAVLTAVVAYLATYQVITIHNICITNLKYVKLLPWAYAYYNNDRIVLWITNPGLISFTVKKVIADNGLILLDHPVGPVEPNDYIVLRFPYVRIRKVITARIYRTILNIVFRGDNDVTDHVTVEAETYYPTNGMSIRTVKILHLGGYVHYIQNTSNIVTLYFEDCSHCDFDFRDLILAVENIGQRLVLVQEHEKGGYPHWLYINNTLINYKPPDAEQEGKEWTYSLKLVETRYTTRKIILYRPKWLTIVACVPHEHICKQFTTPIWNVTILTQVINETTNITSKKPTWYVPHTYTPPGYTTIYISITPPTTPAWIYVKVQTPTKINKSYLLVTKVAQVHKWTKYVILESHTFPYSTSPPGEYAMIYAPADIVSGAFCGVSSEHSFWIMNGTRLILVNPSPRLLHYARIYFVETLHTHIIFTGDLTLTVPIGTKVTLYTPPLLYGWKVLSHRIKVGDGWTNIIGNFYIHTGDCDVYRPSPPYALTDYAFLGYLGPLVNGLVRKNHITFIVNKSGYILAVYTLNPATTDVYIYARQISKPSIEDNIPPIPLGEVYYLPPPYVEFKRIEFPIDTVHLGTEETVKAQIGSTIIIKVRKTITYTYCHNCPQGLCGIGPCWDITIKLQNKTNTIKLDINNITKTYKITLIYNVTNIKQATPGACNICKAPPPGPKPTSSPPPPKVVKYVIANPKAILNGGCSTLEKCINGVCSVIGEVCGG
ncbi:MAG: hypothetical protein GXO43_03325 [Crenarchaeota archaeon]|nr:hypothetical protein [Thermoproteota archaeon]